MKQITISVSNDLVTDNRVNRTCSVFISQGYQVLLVGRKLKDSLPLPQLDHQTQRMTLLFNKGICFYLELNLRLFIKLLFTKSSHLYANDLDTLLPNYLISKIKRIPLVYDTHELFTEVPELQNHPAKKSIWLTLERFIFPRLKHVITVNESIASIYEGKYKVPIHVVRNVPFKLETQINNTPLSDNIKQNVFTVIIQGSGLNVDRGIEEAILAMKELENVQLLLVGNGDLIPKAKIMVQEAGLSDKVLFFDKRPYKELMQFTMFADCGLALDKPTNLNYEYALPNKVFDYIQANTPIICGNLKEIKSLVAKYNIGISLQETTPRLIAEAIRTLQNDSAQLTIYQENCRKAAQIEHWENEKVVLERLIKSLS